MPDTKFHLETLVNHQTLKTKFGAERESTKGSPCTPSGVGGFGRPSQPLVHMIQVNCKCKGAIFIGIVAVSCVGAFVRSLFRKRFQ